MCGFPLGLGGDRSSWGEGHSSPASRLLPKTGFFLPKKPLGFLKIKAPSGFFCGPPEWDTLYAWEDSGRKREGYTKRRRRRGRRRRKKRAIGAWKATSAPKVDWKEEEGKVLQPFLGGRGTRWAGVKLWGSNLTTRERFFSKGEAREIPEQCRNTQFIKCLEKEIHSAKKKGNYKIFPFL